MFDCFGRTLYQIGESMSRTERRNWLIAYDIANHRRLGRVHRYLKGRAIPVQYSVFVLYGSQITLGRVLDDIAKLIAPEADDVRAYHLPDRAEVTTIGRQSIPEEVTLSVRGLDRLLRALTPSGDGSKVEEENGVESGEEGR